jgi:hypothetical protein
MRIHINSPNYVYYKINTLTFQYDHSKYKFGTKNNPDLLEKTVV